MINDTLSERCTGSKKDGSPCGRIAGRDTSPGSAAPTTTRTGPRRVRTAPDGAGRLAPRSMPWWPRPTDRCNSLARKLDGKSTGRTRPVG